MSKIHVLRSRGEWKFLVAPGTLKCIEVAVQSYSPVQLISLSVPRAGRTAVDRPPSAATAACPGVEPRRCAAHATLAEAALTKGRSRQCYVQQHRGAGGDSIEGQLYEQHLLPARAAARARSRDSNACAAAGQPLLTRQRPTKCLPRLDSAPESSWCRRGELKRD